MTPETNRFGVRVLGISLICNLLLGLIKGSLGLYSHSQALSGDALHSFLDMGTDLVILITFIYAARPQDYDHHYGHYKFSSFGTLFTAMLLALGCIGLAYSAIISLSLERYKTEPSWYLSMVCGCSVVIKEWLYWKTRSIAKQIRSSALMANAWHHRMDSLSSVLVLASISAMLFLGPKWFFLDSVVAFFFSLYLGLGTYKLFRQASRDLLDKAPNAVFINDLREHILPTPGAVAYHKFRVRPVGDFFEVDFHLQIDPSVTIREGHEIASRVKANLLQKHPEVLDALIHIEPATEHHKQKSGIYGFSGIKESDH